MFTPSALISPASVSFITLPLFVCLPHLHTLFPFSVLPVCSLLFRLSLCESLASLSTLLKCVLSLCEGDIHCMPFYFRFIPLGPTSACYSLLVLSYSASSSSCPTFLAECVWQRGLDLPESCHDNFCLHLRLESKGE